MSIHIKPILSIISFSLISIMSTAYAGNSSIATADIDMGRAACLQNHAEMVGQDILNAGSGNDCSTLAPAGNLFANNCKALVLPPDTPACGYTFYQDRTILACKAQSPQLEPSDNSWYKYVLCKDTNKEHALHWIRFVGDDRSQLPVSVVQASPPILK